MIPFFLLVFAAIDGIGGRFMNTHIRADKKNTLRLRTDMRASDFKIIRDAGADAESVPAGLLRAKMAREDLYKPLMVGDGFAEKRSLV